MYFHAIESYITLEAELAHFLANVYDLLVHDGNSQELATASADGTLLATIKEVGMEVGGGMRGGEGGRE